jgi:glycosyltransferase involved in cell wall biosynthesis
MRILVATDQWFPDLMGGLARIATETSRRWADAGHEVVVIAPQHPGRPVGERDGSLELLRALPRGRLPQTVTDPFATRRAASRLRETPFDVRVGHTSTTAFGLLGGPTDEPVVYVFHADPVQESRYLRRSVGRARQLSGLALEPVLGRLGRAALRRAACVVVLSEYSRSLLAELDEDVASRAVRVPGGVDATRFHPRGREEARAGLGIADSTRLVFTVRRLVPRMGLTQLLDAAALLADVDGLQLVIAGTGELESALRAQTERLGLDGRVQLAGRVSEEDLPRWHRAADLFVLPTLAHEGFGLVTAEALASGTPVVGTPVGATPELLAPLEPRLVAAGSEARDLADAIRAGLELATPSLRERARAYAEERLSWAATLPAWEAALSSAGSAGHEGRAAA